MPWRQRAERADAMERENEEILKVSDLSVRFSSSRGVIYAVNGISYSISEGEILGIVGESGCGKSTSAYAVTGMLGAGADIISGDIIYRGESLLSADEEQLRRLRGEDIAMIFQNPMQCLDPVFTVGDQMIETVLAHRAVSRQEAWSMSVDMLESVRIRDPEKMMGRFQHELSGGMCQRVMIAMAMLLRPRLLIADEPTTALDVTIQDQILELIREKAQNDGMAVIFITHNLGVVAELCNRVCVMYGGRIVESGSTDEIFYEHVHPYTQGLLESVPGRDIHDKRRLVSIAGSPIDPSAEPKGCPFALRCAYAQESCREHMPHTARLSKTHTVTCRLAQVV